jgi:Rieske Fe-S protein
MKHDVLWTRASFDGPEHPPLAGDAEVDVAIIGGGIVGLAVANLLAGERSVALLEARTIGTQATGRSTAKATSQHGPIYRSLLSDLGEAGARDYAEANEAAIGWIAGMADGGADVCERAEAYVFAETETEAESLRAEAEVAARLGIRARFEPAGDLPFPALGRLAFAGQAQILRPIKGATTLLSENAKAGFRMARDRILRSKVESLEAIGPGEAGIVRIDGRQVAVCRDADGRASAVSAICTHLGCVVGWNALDRTWDCPCHGSRFTSEGEVLTGPAVSPLEAVDLPVRRGQ